MTLFRKGVTESENHSLPEYDYVSVTKVPLRLMSNSSALGKPTGLSFFLKKKIININVNIAI